MKINIVGTLNFVCESILRKTIKLMKSCFIKLVFPKIPMILQFAICYHPGQIRYYFQISNDGKNKAES